MSSGPKVPTTWAIGLMPKDQIHDLPWFSQIWLKINESKKHFSIFKQSPILLAYLLEPTIESSSLKKKSSQVWWLENSWKHFYFWKRKRKKANNWNFVHVLGNGLGKRHFSTKNVANECTHGDIEPTPQDRTMQDGWCVDWNHFFMVFMSHN